MSDQTPDTTTPPIPPGGDPSAEALVLLLDGALPASDISTLVGWSPRAAGSKLRQLERRGYVRRRCEDRDGKPVVVWRLSQFGVETARNKLQASGRRQAIEPATETAAAEPAEPPTAPEPVAEPPTSPGPRDVADDGPWPSLRDATGNPDPERALIASLHAWLFILRAARAGQSEGSAANRRLVETHLKDLERQLSIVWRYGVYALEDGTVITPGRLDYLKQAARTTPPQAA